MTQKIYKDQQLADRFLRFSVLIIRIIAKLPGTPEGQHIKVQLLKCGTSPGANYEEARGAESKADFIHKLGIVLKELKESRFWLRLIQEASLMDKDEITTALSECEELIAIIAKSVSTARKPRDQPRRQTRPSSISPA